MITGELNNSFLNTGCLSIWSSFSYLFCTSSKASEDAVFPIEKRGIVDANPPARVVDKNLRLLIAMNYGI
jgi:hypothetical protein